MDQDREQRPDNNHLAPQLIGALNSVDHFNSKHASMGSAMAGLLFAFIAQEDGSKADEGVSRAEEAEMERELVHMLQADELTSMGIMLFDGEKPGVNEFHKPEDGTGYSLPSSLIAFISDADQFTDTLKHLQPTNEELPQVKDKIGGLLQTTAQLVNAGYSYRSDPDDVDDHMKTAARHTADHQLELFTQIAPALVEAGVVDEDTKAYDRLTEYAVRKQEGILEEYIKAVNQSLLVIGDEGFGPADWTMDMSGELFVDKWTKAFDLLKELRGKGEQSSFYDELVTKLAKDFEQSKKGLDRYYGDAPHISLELAKSLNAYNRQRRDLSSELYKKNGKWPEQEDLTQAGLPERPEVPGYKVEEYSTDSYIASLVEAIDVVEHMWDADFGLERSFVQE